MTKNIEKVRPASAEQAPVGKTRKPFWQRPWIVPLWVVMIGYLLFQTSPYIGQNEATAPLPPHDGFPAYWPILVSHMVLGTVALLLVCVQVWPWVRTHHPKVHRVSGRVYVVAVVITGVLALIIVRFAPPVGQIGISCATLVWMGTSIAGWVAARKRDFRRHRRFMLYSFAIALNNVWGVLIVNLGMALPHPPDINYLVEAARWVGWVGNLMLVQWWLNRTEDRRLESRRAARAAKLAEAQA